MRIIQLATIPGREESLKKTINSLLPQSDVIQVVLNGHDSVPEFLDNSKIEVIQSDNRYGDAAKFLNTERRDGYILTCDDDLAYPEGYVGYMIDGVNRHQAAVSLLGKIYDNRPVNSFRGGYTQIFRCLTSVKNDHRVDIGGTGAMAFHTDLLKLSVKDFPRKNMADIWFARAAKEQNVPIYVLAHPARYVKHTLHSRRIWVMTSKWDRYQTKILNEFLK